jgi:hypothetical protein
MNRFGSGMPRGFENGCLIQVAFGSGSWADEDCTIGLSDVQGVAVHFGIDGDG